MIEYADRTARLVARGIGYFAIGATVWVSVIYLEQAGRAATDAILALPGMETALLALAIVTTVLLVLCTGWATIDIAAGYFYDE